MGLSSDDWVAVGALVALVLIVLSIDIWWRQQ